MTDLESQSKLLKSTDNMERALLRAHDRFWCMAAVAIAEAVIIAILVILR